MTYLLWCQTCTPDHRPDNAEHFATPADRGQFAVDHQAMTGHNDFTPYDLPAMAAAE